MSYTIGKPGGPVVAELFRWRTIAGNLARVTSVQFSFKRNGTSALIDLRRVLGGFFIGAI